VELHLGTREYDVEALACVRLVEDGHVSPDDVANDVADCNMMPCGQRVHCRGEMRHERSANGPR
jgi:hypothetical protein